MVLLAKMYCREQIVIPEQLPVILKKYAKAVIRTQPYDLLRWSAAYFRCLALETAPPCKLRYEPVQQFGKMTRGYIRVLVEQLGKGFYVKRKLLSAKWQGLCLPEEQLGDFLSLCRMLNWSEVHWLKLFAVLVASLNDSLPQTMRMICELLTDEPEGSPAPIPMWMFRTCYKFLAQLDCTETQIFIDGRKLLFADVLEDEEEMPEVPRLHAASVFQDLLLDEWKSRMQFDSVSMASAGIEEATVTSEEATVTEVDSEVSKISSSFKFVGDFDDPTQVIRRAPDFDSVILLLQEELGHVTESLQLDESQIRKGREARKQRICDRNADLAHESELAQRLELLKHIGPPWAWLHQFSEQSCPRKSYNFIEVPSSPLGSDAEEEEFLLEERKASSTVIPEISVSPSSGSTFVCPPDSESGSRSSSSIISQVLTEVMCKLSEAQSVGRITLESKESMIELIREEFLNSPEAEKLSSFLEAAKEKQVEFKDLNELHNYFMGETVRAKSAESVQVAEEEEDQSEVLKECDNPDKIVEIFEASGIDVDNKVLEKQVSQHMILGLVNKEKKETEVPKSPDAESVHSIQSDDTTTASLKSILKRPKTCEKTSQTTSFLDRQRERLLERGEDQEDVDQCVENLRDTIQRSIIPPIPGIGPRVSSETVEQFVLYMMKCARVQKGLVYPRNWQEQECPPMTDE